MKLYFLHGFAGECADWDEVIHHLRGYQCILLPYPFELPSDGILIGYSMGGRIALHSPLPKILISAHPGLQSSQEKEARTLKEQYWIQKLKTVPIHQFFDEWYAQPLFASLKQHPNFPAILQRRLQQSAPVLIQQLTAHPLINHAPIASNTVFIHGALDQTYQNLYQKLQIPSHTIPGAGHACHLENPLDTARQIKISLRLCGSASLRLS